MKKLPIISPKTCQELFKGIEITDTQRNAQEEWFIQLGDGKLGKETENYRWFEDVILRDLLGFPEKLIRNSKWTNSQ